MSMSSPQHHEQPSPAEKNDSRAEQIQTSEQAAAELLKKADDVVVSEKQQLEKIADALGQEAAQQFSQELDQAKAQLAKDISAGQEMPEISFEELDEMPEDVREALLEEEKATIGEAKKLAEKLGKKYAEEDLFPTNELVAGYTAIAFSTDLIRVQARYGDEFATSILKSSMGDEEIQEFIQLMASTDAPPDTSDFEQLDSRSYKKYIQAYKLLQPGTATEKANQLGKLFEFDPQHPEAQDMTRSIRDASTHQHFNVPSASGIEVDDTDYRLEPTLEAELPLSIENKTKREFADALLGAAPEQAASLIEQITQQPLSPEAKQVLQNALKHARQVLDAMTGTLDASKISEAITLKGGDVIRKGRERRTLEALQTHMATISNVPAAGSFRMHHEKFQRERNIPPFLSALRTRLTEPLLGFALQTAESLNQQAPTKSNHELLEKQLPLKMATLGAEALRVYNSLYEKQIGADSKSEPTMSSPMEAIRGFTKWIQKEATTQLEQPGEFHVGRDTLTTTFMARMAQTWGKLTASERRSQIKHVDVSRVVVTNTPRAILAAYLKQNGITSRMTGIDGGFSGSGPQDALLAVMSPAERKQHETTKEDKLVKSLTPQIKLMETHKDATERTFNYEGKYTGVVGWMETLPKYTERSQYLMRDTGPEAKLLVTTTSRDASEQMLAWVVQHAMWREMAPKSSATK